MDQLKAWSCEQVMQEVVPRPQKCMFLCSSRNDCDSRDRLAFGPFACFSIIQDTLC